MRTAYADITPWPGLIFRSIFITKKDGPFDAWTNAIPITILSTSDKLIEATCILLSIASHRMRHAREEMICLQWLDITAKSARTKLTAHAQHIGIKLSREMNGTINANGNDLRSAYWSAGVQGRTHARMRLPSMRQSAHNMRNNARQSDCDRQRRQRQCCHDYQKASELFTTADQYRYICHTSYV